MPVIPLKYVDILGVFAELVSCVYSTMCGQVKGALYCLLIRLNNDIFSEAFLVKTAVNGQILRIMHYFNVIHYSACMGLVFAKFSGISHSIK
jgi:hypothetical protein